MFILENAIKMFPQVFDEAYISVSLLLNSLSSATLKFSQPNLYSPETKQCYCFENIECMLYIVPPTHTGLFRVRKCQF